MRYGQLFRKCHLGVQTVVPRLDYPSSHASRVELAYLPLIVSDRLSSHGNLLPRLAIAGQTGGPF